MATTFTSTEPLSLPLATSQGYTAAEMKAAEMLPQTKGLNVNLANSNKWFAYFPLESVLGRSYSGIEMHLTKFSLPQMEMSSTQVSFRGYTKTIPSKVMNPDTKELTLSYLVDADWQNYKALYLWMCGTEGILNPVVQGEAVNPIQPSSYLPLRIYLLSPYKKKIIQFLFSNCWIKLFNEISLEQSNPGEVEASFTCVYDQFQIEDISA